MEEIIFTSAEVAMLEKFRIETENRVLKYGMTPPLNHECSMFAITSGAGIDLTLLPKEGPMMIALWVTMLTVMKKHYKQEDFKYPTFESFMEQYEGKFIGEAEVEVNYLWHTANWMNVLFTLIPARKNKGLVMQVVPKLVEGWDAKYVTGSGQTRFTANRVHIFEVEGNTRANHRGKHRAGAKKRNDPNNVSRSAQRNIAAEYKSPRRRKRGGSRVGLTKGKRSKSIGEESTDDDEQHQMDYTDGDEEEEEEEEEEMIEPLNQEMVHAYSLFRDTSGLRSQNIVNNAVDSSNNTAMITEDGDSWGLDLIRSTSILNLQTENGIQREVSWTEIPITESSQDVGFGLFSPRSLSQPMMMESTNVSMTSTPIPMVMMPPPQTPPRHNHTNMPPPHAFPENGFGMMYGNGNGNNFQFAVSFPANFQYQQQQQQQQQTIPSNGAMYACTPAGFGWQQHQQHYGGGMPVPMASSDGSDVLEQPMLDAMFRGYQIPVNCARWQGGAVKY